MTPVGTNYASAISRDVDLRLVRPGVIVPPTEGPTASFFYSPTTPREDDEVFFDGSASNGQHRVVCLELRRRTLVLECEPDGAASLQPCGQVQRRVDRHRRQGAECLDDAARRHGHDAGEPDRGLHVLADTRQGGRCRELQRESVNAGAWAHDRQIPFDFGDGSPIVESSGPTVQKAYGAVGAYVVVLQVIDDAGRIGTVSTESFR